jgi:hypothetical protein
MRRSEKYPKSTGVWMAERGWADLTGWPRYVRDAVHAAGIPTRWRGRLFVPAWVIAVARILEPVFSPSGLGAGAEAASGLASVLRLAARDPAEAVRVSTTVLAAYRLGGWTAVEQVLA